MRHLLTFLFTASPASPASPCPGRLPVRTAAVLLSTPPRYALMRAIADLVSVPGKHWNTLYRPPLEAFARYVQDIPASEAHHHASPGGMLDHTLEVVVAALTLRRGHMLPPGAEPEVLTRLEDLWTYATFIGALTHDLGKPAINVHITLFDTAGKPAGFWDPWNGPMPAGFYKVGFARGQAYRLHERVAALLVRLIVPPAGMAWLASDPQVLAAIVAHLSGDKDAAGPVGDIISRADRDSVARNLGAGTTTARFAAARSKPLHEKLLTALRHLLGAGGYPLNRNGAGGWVVGDDLWLVSKRAADALRIHLTEEGHTDIPTRNDRIFDELQQHGILLPNGDHAIWRTRVAHPEWDKEHTLTVLRVPLALVWPDSESRPAPFDGGTVTPLSGSPPPGAETEGATERTPPAAPPAPKAASPRRTPVKSPSPVTQADSADDMPPAILRLADADMPTALPLPKSSFLTWLCKGLADYTILTNQADARVHTVTTGVLLISPAIFRDFAAHSGDAGGWEALQKQFCGLKLHQPARDGSNIHHYRVERPGGNHDRTAQVLKGLLIPEIKTLFSGPPPAPNPFLRAVDS